jgi:hypothetical protein
MRANFSLGQKPITGFSVADPDPGSGAFLIPESGKGKNIWIRIRDKQPGSCISENFKTNFLG